MASAWSQWMLSPEHNRWYRTYVHDDGSRFSQWDNAESPIRDSNNALISRAITHVIPALNSTPRFTPSDHLSSPDRSGSATSTDGDNYGIQGSQPGRPDGVQIDNEDTNDILGPLTSLGRVLDARTMTGQPPVGDEASDLASVVETGVLPPGYGVKHADFFVLGRVFRVLWPEPKGTTAEDYNRDDDVYITLRPAIVVKKGLGQCICVPVYSYGQQGCGKTGLTEHEVQHHAIVHMAGKHPKLVLGEQKWANKIKIADAFSVEPANGATFTSSSRIRFDNPHTVKYNVKVLEVGRVIKDHRVRLQQRFKNTI